MFVVMIFAKLRWPLLLAICSLLMGGKAQAESTEAELKAAFVYGFTKYVEWPAETLQASPESFELCLLGDRNAFFEALSDLKGKSVNNRPLRVREVSHADNFKSCQILVLTDNEAGHFESVLRRLSGMPLLTVNGSSRFLQAGGVISLVSEDNKMRFDINLAAAQKNKLVLSSNLLKLARRVLQP